MRFEGRLPKTNRVILSCVSAFLIVLFMTYSINACWVWLSAQEMIDKSTAIVVGEVIGRTGLNISKSSSVPWQVKVKYYIKGNIKDEYIKVLTPPENTSLHYELDRWGRDVILFLNAGGEYYTPLSPQAVVSIDFDEGVLANKSITNGKQLLEGVSIRSQSFDIEFTKEIEDFIRNSSISQPESLDGVAVKQTSTKEHVILISSISSIAIVSAVFLLIRKLHRVE